MCQKAIHPTPRTLNVKNPGWERFFRLNVRSEGMSKILIGKEIGKSKYENPIGPPFVKRMKQLIGKK